MADSVEIGKSIELANFLSKYAERITSAEGRTYYRLPHWFEQIADDFEFVMHIDLPEDLCECICRSLMGGDNVKIKEPEV